MMRRAYRYARPAPITMHSGDTLITAAGREFFASIGAHNTISIGFQGQSHSYGSAPRIIHRNMNGNGRDNCIAPEWVKLPDGKYALRFTGKPNAFVNFPPGSFPHKNGYTVEFDVLPEEVDRDQVYLGMYGGLALTGFRLRNLCILPSGYPAFQIGTRGRKMEPYPVPL